MIEEGMPVLKVRLSVSQKKKIKKGILYDKQKGKCHYCGNGFTKHQPFFTVGGPYGIGKVSSIDRRANCGSL